MQWWNDFVTWFNSNDGQDVLVNAVVPFFAILVAGVVAAAIGRGSTRRLITLNDRENRVAAVTTLIGAARRASVWNTLSGPEQQHADHVASEADVRIRLLSVPGAGMAADWSAHEIAGMKKSSVSFSFQAEQSLIEFRDRIVTWQGRPSRAKRLFKNDLELWAYEDTQTKTDIVSQQQAWAAAQVAAPSVTPAAAAPSVTPAASAPRAAQPAQQAQPAQPATADEPAAATPTSTAFVTPARTSQPSEETQPPKDTQHRKDAPFSNDTPTVATSVGANTLATGSVDPAAQTPELVHPPRPIGSRDDEPTAEADRRLDEAVYSPPPARASSDTTESTLSPGDDESR